MKKTAYLVFLLSGSTFTFMCGEKDDCSSNNTGSIMIHNDGPCTYTGVTDFYTGNKKIATLAYGQTVTVDNLPVGEINLTWIKSGGDTIFLDKDTIIKCEISHYSTDRLNCASDLRLKKNILPVSNALQNIGKLNIYSFEYHAPDNYSGFLPGGIHYGFIAQELKDVYPSFVQLNANGYYAVNYQEMIPVLAKGIQEQQLQIDVLKKEVEELKSIVKHQQTLANR